MDHLVSNKASTETMVGLTFFHFAVESLKRMEKKVLKLVGGGSVINGAIPSSLFNIVSSEQNIMAN